MGQSPHTADKTALFHYNINDYKQTPDWLNAKYWANPEQFSNDIPEAMQTALQKPEQAPAKLETLGDHIKNKRLIKSQSIEQAAVELNIGPITLWRWEANHYEPQPENLPAVVLYLGYRPNIWPNIWPDTEDTILQQVSFPAP